MNNLDNARFVGLVDQFNCYIKDLDKVEKSLAELEAWNGRFRSKCYNFLLLLSFSLLIMVTDAFFEDDLGKIFYFFLCGFLIVLLTMIITMVAKKARKVRRMAAFILSFENFRKESFGSENTWPICFYNPKLNKYQLSHFDLDSQKIVRVVGFSDRDIEINGVSVSINGAEGGGAQEV